MTTASNELKEAVMKAIENAIEANMTPEKVNEVILELVGQNPTKPPQTTTCGQCMTNCTVEKPYGWFCQCGKTQIVNEEYYFRYLSNQAKWYFNGNFPVYERPAIGHAKVEPTAMQELVNAGLCFFVQTHSLLGAMWGLTEKGKAEKAKKFSSRNY